MKFITNSFSPQMLEKKSSLTRFDEIEEDEFVFFSNGAESYVQHEDVAQILGVPVNKRSLRVRAGDIILSALKLKNGGMRYYLIQIFEAEEPLIREYVTEEAK